MSWRLSGAGRPALSLGGDISPATVSSRTLPAVSGAQSLTGKVTYRCIYFVNDEETPLYEPRLSVEQTQGSDPVEVGFDPAGKNGRAQAIEDDTAAPQGVDFSAPTAERPLRLPGGAYRSGDRVALWLRRTVAPNSRAKKGAMARLVVEADIVEDID